MKKIIAIIHFIAALLWLGGVIWRSFGEIPMWAHVLQGVGIVVCFILFIYNIIVFRRKQTHE